MPDNLPSSHPGVSWRDYVDTRLDGLDKAAKVSRDALEKRLDALNEIRSAMRDQTSTLATKVELEGPLRDLRSLCEWRSSMEGKASQSSVNTAMLLSIVGTLLAILGLILRLVGV